MEQAAKIEAFPAWLVPYVNWQAVITEFLGIWPRVTLDRTKDGAIVMRAYNESEEV